MDEDGYVLINGRIKDVIKSGWESIFPAEVEQFLHRHPAIEDVHVVGKGWDVQSRMVVVTLWGIECRGRIMSNGTVQLNSEK